jgi:hypothetical protein
MNIDTYHYHLNLTRRDDVVRQARRYRLIRTATARRPKSAQAYAAALLALWQSLFR